MRRLLHSFCGLYLVALGLAVLGLTLQQEGLDARQKLRQEFRSHGLFWRLVRTIFVALPLTWLGYGVLMYLSLLAADRLSAIFGIGCLLVSLVACFRQTIRYLKSAWTGVFDA